MEVMSRNGCKKLDKYTIDEVGIPSLVLMENAANKVFDKIVNLEGKFIVFCGNGNNGGDGLAIARKLILEEKDVCIVIVSKDEKYSADFLININILRKLTKNFIYIRNIEDIAFLKEVSSNYNIAIDCIVGVGLNRVLDVFYTKIINYINDKWEFIISIDVPSGLNCDNGEIMGTSIVANKTYTFEVVKMGFINYKALRYLGEVEVLRIGIPQYVKKINSEKVYILSRDDYGKLLRKREKYGHKGMYGKVAILAGSKGYTGAAYISTQSCVMAGAGVTTLVTTKYVQDKLSSKLVEAMTANIESLENLKDLFQKVNVIAIGPGIDEEIKYKDIFLNLIKYKDKKFVIDAGAFNLIKNNNELMMGIKERAIITPHPGEMARLIDKSIDYVEENRVYVARKFAEENKVVVLLKGYNTIITDGECVYINKSGNSKMASGGMGDCLTGIISALLAQGHSTIESAIIGAYVHGLAGELAADGKYSTVASEVIENISRAMNYL